MKSNCLIFLSGTPCTIRGCQICFCPTVLWIILYFLLIILFWSLSPPPPLYICTDRSNCCFTHHCCWDNISQSNMGPRVGCHPHLPAGQTQTQIHKSHVDDEHRKADGFYYISKIMMQRLVMIYFDYFLYAVLQLGVKCNNVVLVFYDILLVIFFNPLN